MLNRSAILMEQGRNILCERVSGVNDNINHAHYHPYYELYYLERGERHFVIGDRLCSTQKGEFALFPPYVMHHAYSGKDIPFCRVLLCFRPDEITSAELLKILENGAGTYRLGSTAEKTISALLNLILEAQENKAPWQETYLRSLVNTILITFAEKSVLIPERPEEKQEHPVSDVISYINSHYQETISLDSLSSHFFLSSTYLCRLFRKYTNLTVIQYVNKTRILYAQRQLTETDDRIIDIALSTGFTNITHFNRIFKQITGTTPAQFRRTARKREPS